SARSRPIWQIYRDASGDCWDFSQPTCPCSNSESVSPMPSSLCLAARLNRSSVKDQVPYSRGALGHDIARVQIAWEECQSSRERNAIYGYLSAVFELVTWWNAEGRAISRARWALQLHVLDVPVVDEPFAMLISCTADPRKVDKRTRSKWSRVLR